MFEGPKFDNGCLVRMLNDPNKFKHLFKKFEMFEGSKQVQTFV